MKSISLIEGPAAIINNTLSLPTPRSVRAATLATGKDPGSNLATLTWLVGAHIWCGAKQRAFTAHRALKILGLGGVNVCGGGEGFIIGGRIGGEGIATGCTIF